MRWSRAAFWDMALLDPKDWSARWIEEGTPGPRKDEDFYGDDPAPLFRKIFALPRGVKRARLYVTGLGYYEAFLNGRRVGDHVLDPGWTNYRKRVYYSTYDVTGHGFRYVEVTGLSRTPALEDLEGLRLNSDVAEIGTFSCSNGLFNRIQDMTRRTFLSNIFSVQSDCPHREKFGYGGDLVATADAYLANFGMEGFYAKAAADWADAARPDGMLTDTAPWPKPTKAAGPESAFPSRGPAEKQP
jgi:hypothetical protein